MSQCAVRHVRYMPRQDLVLPTFHRATQPAEIRTAGAVCEAHDDVIDPRLDLNRVGAKIDLPDDLYGVPGLSHLASRVAGRHNPEQSVLAVITVAFSGHRHALAGTEQRIVLTPPMTVSRLSGGRWRGGRRCRGRWWR
jgi:hypothetical protein